MPKINVELGITTQLKPYESRRYTVEIENEVIGTHEDFEEEGKKLFAMLRRLITSQREIDMKDMNKNNSKSE